jgi:hypothetical protein
VVVATWICSLRGVNAQTGRKNRRKRGKEEEGKKSASWEKHNETQ